jgi:hypothetical protein
MGALPAERLAIAAPPVPMCPPARSSSTPESVRVGPKPASPGPVRVAPTLEPVVP